MKKLVFGLIATVMLSVSSFGQKTSPEDQRTMLNAQVVTIVNVSKSFYTKGQSYDEFIKSLLIPSPTVPSQDEFFKKVYEYVSSDTPDCEIMNADNSEYTKFVSELSESPKNQGDSSTVYAKKKWWQILINIVVNEGLTLLDHQPHNIDMFP